MRYLVLIILAAAGVGWCQTTPSPPAGSADILARVKAWSSDHLDSLPNFLCEQTTEQYRGDRNGKHWKRGDTYVSKLVFADGQEKRTLESVNGKVPSPSSRGFARRPLTTEGEFGILLANIVGEHSQAQFDWDRWTQKDDRRLAVFRYVIDVEHSTVRLTDGPYMATVGYGGEIAADPETGEVLRIVSKSVTPSSWEMQSLTSTIDYGPVMIGGKRYLLPVEATVEAELRDGKIRNHLIFSQYQKFETGSTITFGPPQE